jgi:hypothetical protein
LGQDGHSNADASSSANAAASQGQLLQSIDNRLKGLNSRIGDNAYPDLRRVLINLNCKVGGSTGCSGINSQFTTVVSLLQDIERNTSRVP